MSWLTHNMAHTNQPPSNSLINQYMEFRQQTSHNSQPSHPPNPIQEAADEDLDMDAQLENVSPERGGSSLQISTERNFIQVVQATPRKSTHLFENTPPTLAYRNLGEQTTKRRKSDDFTATSTPAIPSKGILPPLHTRSRRITTLGIDMLGQMWLGFHMHELLIIQKRQK